MLILPAGTPTKEDTVAKYKLTAIVDTNQLDLKPNEIDVENPTSVEVWLQYDSEDTPLNEVLTEIKVERIPDDG